MFEVILDQKLKIDPGSIRTMKGGPAGNLESYLRCASPKPNVVFTNVPESPDIYHWSVLHYLSACWHSHHGVVLTPDMVWFTLMNQVAQMIRENAEAFRPLFSESEGKREIIIETGELVRMPMERLVLAINSKLPSNNAALFTPEFSTTDELSREAVLASFADAMSPYYDYSMLLCGLSKVRVDGTVDDWTVLQRRWAEISVLFVDHISEPEFQWMVGVGVMINGIHLNAMVAHGMIGEAADAVRDNERLSRALRRGDWDLEIGQPFWRGMFRYEKCGSGHDTIGGWFTSFFRKQPKLKKISNFEGQVAMLEYKNLSTGRKFRAVHGPFSSTIQEGDWLLPQFGQVVMDVTDDPEDYKPKTVR